MLNVAHIGIFTRDSEASKDFYCRVLGSEYVDRFEDENIKIIFVKVGTQIIEFVQFKNTNHTERTAGIIDHLAFEVIDIEKEIARISALGIEFQTEKPKDVLNGKKNIFFLGPDGERLELIQN